MISVPKKGQCRGNTVTIESGGQNTVYFEVMAKPVSRNSHYDLGLGCAKSKEALGDEGVPQTSWFTWLKFKSTLVVTKMERSRSFPPKGNGALVEDSGNPYL